MDLEVTSFIHSPEQNMVLYWETLLFQAVSDFHLKTQNLAKLFLKYPLDK